jgi:hypothetical protein
MRRSIRCSAYHAGINLAEKELLVAAQFCPLCSFNGERKIVLTLQRSPDVFLLRCPCCHGASASRMPKPEALETYYRSYLRDCSSRVTFYRPARFARHILNLAGKRWAQPVFHILDFGGGDGALSNALAELLLAGASQARKVEIDLVDYHEAPATPSMNTAIRRLKSLKEASADYYELVLASAIVEHIPEPAADIQTLFAAIGANGCFYARTPWVGPLLGLLERLGIDFDFTYPAHVHDLGKPFWEHLIERVPIAKSRVRLRHSHPSIVETGFGDSPLRTLAAYVLKAPWRLLPNTYAVVGGVGGHV